MNLVPTAVAAGVGRQMLTAQKHSPTILFGLGVVGMIGSTVLACRATLKMDEMIAETKGNLEKVKKYENIEKGYNEEHRRRDVAVVYGQGIGKVARAYAPAILLGAAAIACLTKSHSILMQRNAAITAAYVAVDTAFKNYRSRVREKYGEEEDLHLMHESESVEILNEKGNITHSTRVTGVPSQYARFFDQLSTCWSRDPEYNLIWLKQHQEYWNHVLITRGHVFLNEVYKDIGLDHTQAGSVVGWVLTKDGSTNNFVDFGLYADNKSARDFINGREGSVLLDFNVDGLIWDKLGKPTEKLKWQS